ncbi:MAG: SusF/SusE family outer membrane protein, partial [Lachnospiraceae bacterium]|nr:SusF/SusE family outer membrane protein [Lachnospiraceae bacterium]
MKKGKSSYSVKIDNLTANTTYYVRYLAVNNYSSMISEKSSKFKTQAKSEPNEPDNPIDPLGREYVDLGLSVKWATCNVGATKPEEYGDYFAWGETALKSTFFGWDSYKFYDAVNGFTKYNQSDNRFTLDPEDDVAFMNWGGGWRMPTQSEIQELFEDCVWTSEIQNGVRGKKVVGPNGNAIFLPAGGYESDGENELIGYFGSYWSSSLGILNNWYYGCAYSLHFFASFDSVAVHLDGAYRRYGKSIRPVWGESRDNPDDNFNDNSTEMYMIGEDFGGWDWNNEGVVSLIPVHSAEGAFWTIKPLKAGKQFKFCSKKEWNGDFNSLGEDSGYVIVDGNCSVESDGIYMIYVDVKNKKLVIEPAAVYGIGDCFGSWDKAMRSAKFAV